MGDMIFKPAARYPADPRAVFILALSVFSGLTALVLDVAPQSLEALLPHWAVVSWGSLLVAGSAITLIGMAFQSFNGIIIEQIGSVVVGATTLFYAGIILAVVGIDAIQNVGIILAWGLSCFLRWGQLQILINDAQRRAMKQAMLDKVYADIEEHKADDAKRRREAMINERRKRP